MTTQRDVLNKMKNIGTKAFQNCPLGKLQAVVGNVCVIHTTNEKDIIEVDASEKFEQGYPCRAVQGVLHVYLHGSISSTI